MKVIDIRTFIPSKDYEVSKNFYTKLGFTSDFVSNDLTIFKNGNSCFFLQRYYTQEFAENLMFQLIVEDIQEAFELANSNTVKTKISPIAEEPWGQVFYLWGPAGELWHITQLNMLNAK